MGLPMFSHGGARPGAGRPRTSDRLSHVVRPEVKARTPVHVTITFLSGYPTLRSRQAYRIIQRALYYARQRFGVRIAVQSTQQDHLHLVVEAPDHLALGRAMQGLSVRMVRGLNRLWNRKGKLLRDRYHARVLRSPLEVRRALAYVLMNQRHHAWNRGYDYPKDWIDPFSSALQCHGWREPPAGGAGSGAGPPTVVAPGSWLLRKDGLPFRYLGIRVRSRQRSLPGDEAPRWRYFAVVTGHGLAR